MNEKFTDVDLKGKTAIVTGGSRGIGRAICLALAQAGANVVVSARTEKENPSLPGTIHQTVEEIRQQGGKAIAVRCDVTDAGQISAMVNVTINAWGAIDILVNNAGILHGANFLQTDMGDFENVWRVNVLGPFLCTHAVLKHMMERKKGSIVNISSGLAESTMPHNNVYSASKAALDRMMIKLANEIVEYNIAVNQVYPGMIRSEGMMARMPGSQMMDGLPPPSIVGPPVVWLAARDAGYTGKICRVAEFGKSWP